MASTIKLRLKKAIILEDHRRLLKGENTINNIRRLALLMEEAYPNRYVFENVNVWLCKLNTTGIKNIDQTYVMNQTINDLCEVLHIDKEDLINEIEDENY
ncbi:hypothetical protein J0X14_12080 [Muricauda sp. CAU 1633]|uniref:hypothetical protein n=1 Tax=Allomuricauda sp. CAU 1633 TaxID=2816036 RepID=UPI001A8D5EC4|nr:hypothetical protein [Muricauda sp. CAU 1633]MBO0323037.1 hypothetical protein [Muricauda sp. CAU 1633]